MALDPYTPYPTSPTVARNLITEVDTGYLFGVEKSEVAVTDLPVVVPVGYQMSKLGPFRVTGRLTTLGQSRVTSAASPITGLILPAENISVAYLAGATYTNVQDYINTMTSPGLITGGDVANAGGGNITVAAGTAMLRIADDDVATLKFVDFPAATLAIPNDGANRYIGLVYDNGNPHVELRTTFTWDNDTEIALGSVIQADGFMFTFSNPLKTGDPLTNIIQRFDSILPTNRDVVVGGLTMGETGTRSITMTAGRTWSRLNDHDIAAIDTSAGSFFATFYYDGATWQFSGFNQTQWDNLQYNDITSGLVAMTAGYYANIWFYIHAGHGYLGAIYGQNQYLTLAGALAESGPGITPPNWTIHTIPIAKLTFQKSAATASQIAQAYTSPFSTVPLSAHNDLTGLQGGAAAEYYHLSASEYTGTGTGNFVRLNSPVLTGTPGAPTAAPGTNTTQLATTAFVTAAIAAAAPPVTSVFGRIGAVVAVSGDYTVAQVTGAAPLASPTFTGIPAAPTPITADNSTTIATTAFVKNQGYLTGNQTITLTGDVTGSGATSIATTLTTAQPGAHTWADIQTISNATASTSTTTGALVVTGGVGIGGALNVGGAVAVSSTITQTNTMSGASTSLGVNISTSFLNTAGANRALNCVASANPSSASTAGYTGMDGSANLPGNAAIIPSGTFFGVSGATRVLAGTAVGTITDAIGVYGHIRNENANITITAATGMQVPTPTTTGPITTNYGIYVGNQKTANVTTSYGLYVAGQTAGSYAIMCAGSGLVKISDTTASTSTTTGALVVTGGVGVGLSLVLDGATTKVLRYTNATANAAVAVTFGAVGPTGSTAGNQQGWMRVNMGGTDRYVPFW